MAGLGIGLLIMIPCITSAQTVDVTKINSEIKVFQDIINFLENQIVILQAELAGVQSVSSVSSTSSLPTSVSSDVEVGSASPSPSVPNNTPVPTTIDITSPTHVYSQDGVAMPEVYGGGCSEIEFDGAVYDQFGNVMPNQPITTTNSSEGINDTRFPRLFTQAPSGSTYYFLNLYPIENSSTTETFNFQSGNLLESIQVDVLGPDPSLGPKCTT